MSINALLNQTLAISNRTGKTGDGRDTYGSPTNVRGRFQVVSKTIFSPRGALDRGALLTIDGIAYVPASTTVAIDDKVTYAGVTYKVYSKYPVPGLDGQTHHIKLQLLKWQT